MRNDESRNNILTASSCCASRRGADKGTGGQGGLSTRLGSDRGIALIVVLLLSAIALTIITALFYVITVGTQTSGMNKRYKTALEAGYASINVVQQVVNLQGTSTMSAFNSSVTNSIGGILSSFSTSSALSGCTGGAIGPGLVAKIMAPTNKWSAGCDSVPTADATTYDFQFNVGTNPQYMVYAKIVDTTVGNTGGDVVVLRGKGVVSSGDLPVLPISSVYTIEVDAESTGSAKERAKLEVVYQY